MEYLSKKTGKIPFSMWKMIEKRKKIKFDRIILMNYHFKWQLRRDRRALRAFESPGGNAKAYPAASGSWKALDNIGSNPINCHQFMALEAQKDSST